ncbi:MAG: ATPase, partial [Elusimicrobia bacterium]|nr:ATPase [Elusimicrobiota bacterium]
MILIADSGSTKTTWVLIDSGRKIAGQCQTAGINPFYQSEDDIFNSISKEFTLKVSGLKSLFFYGAGCTDSAKKGVVLRALKKLWNPDEVLIESDLLCAARSLCGFKPGIAAILGTGS